MDFQYIVLQQVGQGAYGCVFKAINNGTKEVVAIKQLKNKLIAKNYENGTKLGEIVALEDLRDHPNIVQLKEVIQQGNDLFYVFEYMPTNLLQMIRDIQILSEVEIQSWMYQILDALAYMHSKGYIHRDLKPENILANRGTIKLADFGLSKKMGLCFNNINAQAQGSEYCGKEGCTCGCTTTYMCTRWYRAPEILVRSSSYSTSVDMWSLGAIMAEMYRSQPIFPGVSEENQLDQISAVLGAPDCCTWNEGCTLANTCKFQFKNTSPLANLATRIPNASYLALDLIQSLLVWDPRKRLTALQALNHPFFKSKPRFHEEGPHFVSHHLPTTVHHPFMHRQVHNTTCAMENNEQQRLNLNAFHNQSFISSYRQACNFIQKNSIVR